MKRAMNGVFMFAGLALFVIGFARALSWSKPETSTPQVETPPEPKGGDIEIRRRGATDFMAYEYMDRPGWAPTRFFLSEAEARAWKKMREEQNKTDDRPWEVVK